MSLPTLKTRQSGFTLVEFMIAGVIGLIILSGVLSLLVNTQQTFTLQRGVADVQDSGRFALHILKSDIERAGFGRETPLPSNIAILRGGENATQDGCNAGANGAPNSDCLVIQYDGNRDCTGEQVNGAEIGQMGRVTNRYFLRLRPADPADNVRLGELVCQSGGRERVLLDNVEDFQILYGLDGPDDADNAPDRYQAEGVAFAGNDVVAVRVGFIIASEANILDQARTYSAAQLDLFNTGGMTRTDRRIRRRYSQTISLPSLNLSPNLVQSI